MAEHSMTEQPITEQPVAGHVLAIYAEIRAWLESQSTSLHLHTPEGRRAFLLRAGLDQQLQQEIDLKGPLAVFCPVLVDTLARYGTLQDGRNALAAILETAKQSVGQEHRQRCDVLLRQFQVFRLQSAQSQEPTPGAGAMLFPLTPIPEPGDVVDRERLQRLLKTFLGESSAKVFVLQGMGGIGKTVLLAKVLRDAYDEKLIYWHTCSADTQLETILGELHTFLMQHDIRSLEGVWNNRVLSLRVRLNALLQGMTQPFLLVFDDLQTLLDDHRRVADDSLRGFFEHLLSKQHRARILLSSRFNPVVSGVPAGVRHNERLRGLEPQDSLTLLRHHGMRAEPEELLHTLHDRFEGHPLALVVAGQLWERGYSLDEIARLPVTMIDEESGERFLDRLLTELWSRLKQEEQIVLTALSIYRGFVPVEAVQMFYERTAGEEHPIKRKLLQLADCSLIQREHVQGAYSYSVHGLIRESVLRELSAEQKRTYHHKAAEYWESLEWSENPTRFEELQERIECRWHYYQAEEYENATRIAFSLSTYLQTRCGLYSQALDMMLETQEHVESEKDQAHCYNEIGFVYDSQGQYQEALTYYEQSREIRERLGLEVDLATTYFNIGMLYAHQGDLEQAEEYISRTVEIEEKIGHPDLEDDRAALEGIRKRRQNLEPE